MNMESDHKASVARARTLKECCYGAWHSEPARLAPWVAELTSLADDCARTPCADEIRGLALWSAALADIAAGELTAATQRLEAAYAHLVDAGCPLDAAQTRIPLIMVLGLLGSFDDAHAQASAACNAFMELGDLQSAARVTLNLGSLCYSEDRYAEAAEHYSRASARFAQVGDREHSILADIGRGDACSFLGDLDEAVALYRRAEYRARTRDFGVIRATATQALAEVAMVRGAYQDALAGLDDAIRTFSALGAPMLRMQAERALAEAYVELQLVKEAQNLLAAVDANLDAESPARPWIALHLARLAAQQHDTAAAEALLARAEASFIGAANEVGIAEVALGRSALAIQTGTWCEARRHARAAEAHLAGLQLPTAQARLAVAAADTAEGSLASAIRELKALTMEPGVSLPVHERAQLWLGRALLRSGDQVAARTAFEQAVALSEAGLGALPSDDFQRGYLRARAEAYEELLRLTLVDNLAEPGEHTAAAVLGALEQLRARTLPFRVQKPDIARRTRRTLEQGAEPDPDRERLDWLYRKTNRYQLEAAEATTSDSLTEERIQLELRILERLRRGRLARTYPAHETLSEPMAAQSIAARLGPDEAFVAYGFIDDELFAVVLSQDSTEVHRGLACSATLTAARRAWRNQLETLRLGMAHLERHRQLLEDRARATLGALYDLLWRPLAGTLDGCRTIRILPTTTVADLPFAALWDGRQHVIEQFAISFLLSTASLAAPTSTPASRRNVILLADPARLPGTRAETEALVGIWPEAGVACASSTNRAGFSELSTDADILHIACHGEFRAENPLFSALHLGEDMLTALDIEQLSLPAQPLVILSACDSARSDGAGVDESLGLVRAFQVAGASNVIASLWPIDDAGTANWMIDLHRRLHAEWGGGDRCGASVTEMVASVQREQIRAGAHPANWAAFCVSGRDTPAPDIPMNNRSEREHAHF